MSGFEVEIADMDLIKQVFDRQQGHMNAIRDYVQNHCTTPGGFGIVLQPLAPHYESAYHDGVTGLGNGATVAQACSSKIVDTKQALLDTDRKQYERYAQHQADMGHDVPPYHAPPGGGTLPAASSSYTPGDDDEAEYPSIEDPYKYLAEKGYDVPHYVHSAAHVPEHAAPENGAGDNGSSDAAPRHRADPGSPDTSSSGGGAQSGDSSVGASGDPGGSGDPGPQHRSDGPRHEAEDEPNVIGKATEIYNAPGEYYETGKDYVETVETRNDLDEATDAPVNDDQTEWANSGSAF